MTHDKLRSENLRRYVNIAKMLSFVNIEMWNVLEGKGINISSTKHHHWCFFFLRTHTYFTIFYEYGGFKLLSPNILFVSMPPPQACRRCRASVVPHFSLSFALNWSCGIMCQDKKFHYGKYPCWHYNIPAVHTYDERHCAKTHILKIKSRTFFNFCNFS